jgi:hypothetical protein
MLNVAIAKNPLDRTTWVKHENVTDLAALLSTELGPFPATAKIYHGSVEDSRDVTPRTPAEAKALQSLKGTLHVINWPGAPVAVAVAVNLAILATVTFIKWALGPDEKVTARVPPKGSPNNFPGDRLNTARVMDRIPDIYGRVKCTPDLIQAPYVRYRNNLQIETTYMCVGQGTYTINAEDVKEGETLVSQIGGASLEVYPPGNVPGSGTPQLTIGTAINEPIYNVVQVKSINDDVLLAPNNTYIAGDTGVKFSGVFNQRIAPLFEFLGAGLGKITYNCLFVEEGNAYVTDKITGGDKVGLSFHRRTVSVYEDDLIDPPGAVPADRPDLNLLPETPDDDHYVVDSVTEVGFTVEVVLQIPASKIVDWNLIVSYNPSGGSGGDGSTGGQVPAPLGTLYNRGSILYLLNYHLGTLFVNDPDAEECHVNLVAPNGLWVDDGVNQRAFGGLGVIGGGVRVNVDITPCDASGVATGPKSTTEHRLFGSQTNRNLSGETFVIPLTTPGRFLLNVYRVTLTPFREDLRSWTGNDSGWNSSSAGGDNRINETGTLRRPLNLLEDTETPGVPLNFVLKGQVQDEVRCTHVYSMSEPKWPRTIVPLSSLGNITTVQLKRMQRKSIAEREPERRLNMMVTRNLPVYDINTDSFIGTFQTVSAHDAVFDILRNSKLGSLDDDQIDFEGIYNAFAAVTDSFTDSTITSFSHTFDSKDTSLEEMLTAIGESCLVTFYRQGDVIKAEPDISTQDASLLFNHRNKVPGTETRTGTFATEEEYDGVEIEYTDDVNNQIQLYTIPATGIPRNPRKVRLAGVRNRRKAAMHAWRAYHRLQYQFIALEFEALEEASMSLTQERILVSDGTHPDVHDGELTGLDGLVMTTSQPAVVSGASTLFLQGYSGAVAAIPVIQGDHDHELVALAAIPAGTVNIDLVGGQSTKYFLVRNASTATKAFRVTSKEQKSDLTYNITAINYTEGYYFYDGIRVYLPFKVQNGGTPPVFGFDDRSPQENVFEETGSPTVSPTGSTRGAVYRTVDSVSHIQSDEGGLLNNSSYTFALWVFNEDLTDAFPLRSTGNLNEIIFTIDSSDRFPRIFHSGTQYLVNSVAEPLNEWRHYAVVYDRDTDILLLYINGQLESTAIDVPGAAGFDGWRVGHYQGRMDSVRIYRSTKPAEFIQELYQKELIV